MVSMTMRLDGTDSLMARQASIPVCLGIRTSMRTTSGSSSSARRSASIPSPASPTTSMPVLGLQHHLQAAAEQDVVVGHEDPDRLGLAARVHARHRTGARLDVWPAPAIQAAHVGHHCTRVVPLARARRSPTPTEVVSCPSDAQAEPP